MKHSAILQHVAVALLLAMMLVSCNRGSNAARNDDRQASLLVMTQKRGYLKVEIKDPWHNGKLLHTYLLVPRDSVMPRDLPAGTVVRTPVRRALVYSEVHTSVMRELGGFEAVKGVCDANYFTDPEVLARVKHGAIADCGSSSAPSIERVIAMKPDAILLSPYQDATYGQVEKLGIPLIECADYLEYSPLGRAEWARFYGALLGSEERGDSLYRAVRGRYDAIVARTQKATSHPSVITEMVISGVWSVPGGNSYMARVIKDAGGSYPWSDDKSTGSLSLDFDQVLAKAQNADFWFIKWTGINTLAQLQAQYDLNKNFKAFKTRRVWVCDTGESHFFVRIPFHPDVLLHELAAVLHPELFPGYRHEYYHHLDR